MVRKRLAITIMAVFFCLNLITTTGAVISLNSNQLQFSFAHATLFGGTDLDYAYDMAVDSRGYIYVTGATDSTDLAYGDVYQNTGDGSGFTYDVFVSKFTPEGQLVFTTYITGDNSDVAKAIAVDDNTGNIYIGGYTSSTDFPNSFSYGSRGASSDAFILVLSSDGRRVLESDILPGDGEDQVYDIYLSPERILTVVGRTSSTDFYTTTGAYDESYNTGQDLFVIQIDEKFNPVFSTYIGGSGDEYPDTVGVDSLGNIYIGGYSDSTDYPRISAYKSTMEGTADAIISKLSTDGSSLLFSTYYGGDTFDRVTALTVDSSDNIYFTGYTSSTDLPALNAYNDTKDSSSLDCYVAGFSGQDGSLLMSSYLGGNYIDTAIGIQIVDGNLHIISTTQSSNYPVTDDALQSEKYQPESTAFANMGYSVLSLSGELLYSSYFGTSLNLYAALVRDGYLYILGTGQYTNPTTYAYLTPGSTSGSEMYVAAFGLNGAVKVDDSTVTVTVTETSNQSITESVTETNDGFTLPVPFPAWITLLGIVVLPVVRKVKRRPTRTT